MTPPRPILRIGWAIHKALFAMTGGRVGTERPGRRVGTLFLLSRGRKTGAVRRNGLFYVEDGAGYVVAASNAGEDADPQWWLNLQANPEADVELGRERVAVRARPATADEAARLWPRLEAGYPEYAAYRARAARDIPVVLLVPTDRGARGSASAHDRARSAEAEQDRVPLVDEVGDRDDDENGSRRDLDPAMAPNDPADDRLASGDGDERQDHQR